MLRVKNSTNIQYIGMVSTLQIRKEKSGDLPKITQLTLSRVGA